jgi:hypothetical protein
MPMSFLGVGGGVKAFLTGLGTEGVGRLFRLLVRDLLGRALVELVALLTTLSTAPAGRQRSK